MKAALVRCAAVVVLGVVPLGLLAFVAVHVAAAAPTGSDFGTFWEAGRAVLHGRSPYPPLSTLPAHADVSRFAPFVYPPVTAFAFVPFALLPYGVAKLLFLALSLGAVALALRLLGVRDVRCYGAAFASSPVFASGALGTISPLLLLGVAAAWRYRDRAVALGLLVASVVTAKLFLWPVWLWLLRTRRFTAAAIAAAAGAAAVAAAWAGIGFAGLRDYPELLRRLTALVGGQSYSLHALVAGPVATVLVVVAVAAAARFVRGEVHLLVAALGIALLATPILWPHYLVLLFVPLALARPAFSPAWLAPLVLWLDSSGSNGGSTVRVVVLLGLVAPGLAWILAERPPRRQSPALGVPSAGGL